MPTKLAAVSGILAGSRPFSVWRRREDVGEARMVRFPEKKSPAGLGGLYKEGVYCVRQECDRTAECSARFPDISILRVVDIRMNKINKDGFFDFIEEFSRFFSWTVWDGKNGRRRDRPLCPNCTDRMTETVSCGFSSGILEDGHHSGFPAVPVYERRLSCCLRCRYAISVPFSI